MLLPRASLFLVLVTAGLTCLTGLGSPAISDSDEAFYAEAAREMVESGDYLTPRFNYENRFQKPVLYYWLAAWGFEVAGVTEAAARLPSALSGIALAVLGWWCGRRWYDEAVGRTAGLVVATSAGAVTMARLSLPDLPLAFFISLAVVLGSLGLLDSARLRRGWLLGAAAAAGLGFLTKGPLAVVVPALVLVPLVALERRWRNVRPAWLAAAGLVFAAVALPWYGAMTAEHGYGYLHGFFVGDNLERFATDRFNEPRPIWFYVPIAIGGMLPWSPLALAAVPPLIAWLRGRWRPGAPERRLLIWTVLPLLLFTASVGKQPRYILPILPPLAIAIAAAVHARLRSPGRGRDVWLAAGGSLTALFLVAAGFVVARVPTDVLDVPAWLVAATAAFSVGSGLAVAWAAWRRQAWIPGTVTAAGAIVLLGLQLTVVAAPGGDAVREVAAALRPYARDGIPWTSHHVFVRNLVFYVRTPQEGPYEQVPALVERLRRPEPLLVVLDRTDVERIEPLVPAPLVRLGTWEYFNVAAVRLRTLADPRHEREFRTVVLVANDAAAALIRNASP